MRDFLNTDKGRYLAIAAGAVGTLLLAWLAFGVLSEDNASRSADRVFIDARTGQQFGYTLVKGDSLPIPSPHSNGDRVGYEAEPCYWTTDGKIKEEPTWVLPMVKVDAKAGPTFCNDCGRLVRPRNPVPTPGSNPPPTEAEYKAPRSTPGTPAPSDEYPDDARQRPN
jgi:hypothetical protein